MKSRKLMESSGEIIRAFRSSRVGMDTVTFGVSILGETLVFKRESIEQIRT